MEILWSQFCSLALVLMVIVEKGDATADPARKLNTSIIRDVYCLRGCKFVPYT